MTAINATYLDWNATAPVGPAVAAAVAAALTLGGNPSSVHRNGRAARKLVNAARDAVAALVNASAEEIVFTSGGTEANALALRGFPGRRAIVSAIEHASVREAADGTATIRARGDGRVDLDALERLLAADRRPALVSLMLANNETGVIQDVAEAARIAHRHGALFHTDAIQAPGRIAVDFRELDADLMTLSAHKLGGPMGVGALVVRRDLQPQALLKGGGQERGRRAGTENLPGIAGFGVAARIAADSLATAGSVAALRDRAQQRLLAIAPDATVCGADGPRLPNTLSIAMPRVAAATQVIALDLAGVMVSAGSACSSGKVERSPVLDAMGVPADIADCAIRISLGSTTTDADIDRLVEAWGALHARTRASAA
jgi:cysteine desulfurase